MQIQSRESIRLKPCPYFASVFVCLLSMLLNSGEQRRAGGDVSSLLATSSNCDTAGSAYETDQTLQAVHTKLTITFCLFTDFCYILICCYRLIDIFIIFDLISKHSSLYFVCKALEYIYILRSIS